MDRKTFTIVLAVALIASFFLPFYDFGGRGASGFDLVKSSGGEWQKYLLLVFPVCGVLLLVGAMNNGNYPGGRGLLAWLPLLTLLFILILYPIIRGADIGIVFKSIGRGYGLGLWIAVASSLVLAFYNPRA
ncbi:MAG TPA: hypothetical protein VGO58_01490 [Chitinophagaceae bacterium]|jgi:hypothetical protein|nr:hypothetical protein [Chitinophagaceae bacterium]